MHTKWENLLSSDFFHHQSLFYGRRGCILNPEIGSTAHGRVINFKSGPPPETPEWTCWLGVLAAAPPGLTPSKKFSPRPKFLALFRATRRYPRLDFIANKRRAAVKLCIPVILWAVAARAAIGIPCAPLSARGLMPMRAFTGSGHFFY